MRPVPFLIGIVITFFLLGLLAFAPARLGENLTKRFSGGRLLLLQSAGSLWHGQGKLYIKNQEGKLFSLGLFDWRISSLALLMARLQIEAQQTLDERTGHLQVNLSPSGMTIRNTTFHLQGEHLAHLSPVLSSLTPSGILQLTSDLFEIQNTGTGHRYEGLIRIDWQPATFLDGLHAGNYRITLHGNGQPNLDGQLLTLAGNLDLQGNIHLNQSQQLSLDGQVRLLPGTESARLLPIFRALCGDGKEHCRISAAH